MNRRVPIVSTIVVLAAVALMVSLGIWQLHRKSWKEGLIARYQAAEQSDVPVPWPSSRAEYDSALYRRSEVDCAAVTGFGAIAGRSAAGQPGWAHLAHCRLPSGAAADVALGWSNDPGDPRWRGGKVAGWVVSAGEGVRLTASPPQAGLMQLAKPDPANVATTPMGHLSYAIQWFAFALIALAIYVLALRKRWHGARDELAGGPPRR